jgi:hypothetical protein
MLSFSPNDLLGYNSAIGRSCYLNEAGLCDGL